jgi:hypothetical protein
MLALAFYANKFSVKNWELGTTGHVGTFALDASNASGESTSTLVGTNPA